MATILTTIKTKKRMLLALLVAVIVGGTGSAVVFASIPNSSTGNYDACRSNLTGGVRIIDTQSGQNCFSLTETAVSWQSAAAAANGPKIVYGLITTSGTLDTSFSGSEVQNFTSEDTDFNTKKLCFNLSFSPKAAKNWTMDYGEGVLVRGGSTEEQNRIDAVCGSQYEAYAEQPSFNQEFKYVFMR